MSYDEVFPIVNADGEVTGKALRSECHANTFLLHPVVHLHVFNSKGELYLQKRSVCKIIQPGMWDTSVGGHVEYGEDIETALFRETREELGIIDFDPQFLCKYLFRSHVEEELVYVYKTVYDGVIVPDKSEIDDGRFWTIEDILSKIGSDVFTPNFEHEAVRFLL